MNEKEMKQRTGDSEFEPLSLCTDISVGKISEKKWKKKKKRKSSKKYEPLSESHGHGVPDPTQNGLSVGMHNSNGSSRMRNDDGFPDELKSDSCEVLQDSQSCGVLQSSKVGDFNGSVCEDTKTGSRKPCTNNGKENRNSGWKKRQHNDRDAQKDWKKKSGYRYASKHVYPQENSLWVENDSLIFSGHNSAAYGYKKIGHKEPFICGRVSRKVLDESVKLAASQQRLNGNRYRYVSLPSQLGGLENGYEKLMGNSTNSFKRGNCNGKNGLVSFQKELPQVPFDMNRYKNRGTARRTFYNGQHVANLGDERCLNSSSMYSSIFTQGMINGIQPYKFMKTPSMEHEFGRCLYGSVDGVPWSEFKSYSDHMFKKDVTSGVRTKKWIPVDTKESRPMEGICSTGISKALNLNIPGLSKGLNDSHLVGNSIPFSSSTTLFDTNCISSHQLTLSNNEDPKFHKSAAEIEGQKIESQFYEANGKRPKNSVQFLIGSQMAVEALKAAYKMQLASETVHLARGFPLQEFERLIHCAAPVIASSYVHKECSVCLDTQLSHSFLCKHQIPNLSLRTVWNWYEKPGNYGLDVKVGDSETLNGFPIDSMSFHAHFVPSLSAVQLFGPRILGSKTLFPTRSSEAAELNHIQAETENFDSVKEPVRSFDVVLHDGSGPLSLDCSPDSELVFEFFESEMPQLRKPFYDKIMELIGVGTSNHRVFGDPSKLDCLNLHDLHPASWFSVAWYPIYQIPEGHFRASFLTYHSLGHFVQRPVSTDVPNKHTSRILSPVLGLQSYNAQGECWFEPKLPTSFNSTEILKERLRTLEENALRFARGCVCKDKVMVFNRHPDYEFFISRKTHYK